MDIRPPPGSAGFEESRQRDWQALIVGDSGLSLSKSKGNIGYDWGLELGLGITTQMVRLPGEGAAARSYLAW